MQVNTEIKNIYLIKKINNGEIKMYLKKFKWCLSNLKKYWLEISECKT